MFLGAFLIINALVQPGYSKGPSRTLVGEICSVLRGEAQSHYGLNFEDYFVIPVADGTWQVLTDDDGQPAYRWGDSYSPLPGETVVSRLSVRRSSGVWSLSWRSHRISVSFYDGAGGTPPASSAQRQAMLAAIDAKVPGVFPASRRAIDTTGGDIRYEILWLGVINDVLVLTAGIGFVVSLSWLFGPRKSSTTVCPSCEYSLEGLAAGSRCPECGRLPG